MKGYLVKRTYQVAGDEVWAFDKTCIRKSFYTNSNVVKIIEIPN